MAVSVASTGRPASNAWRRRLGMAQDAALVCVSAVFLYVYAQHVIESQSLTNVFFVIEQALLVGMFLFRRRSENTSIRPQDWLVATVGGWGPLFMRPHEIGGAWESVGAGVQLAGLTLVIISFATLGKSFGIVAANRGLKVGGPYRLIRHPIYFSHWVTMSGFIMANFWWPNLAILAVVSVCQVLRIQAEERVLTETSDYADYKKQVRWRLLPGLY